MSEFNNVGQPVQPSPSIPRISIYVHTGSNPPHIELDTNMPEAVQIIGVLSQAIGLLVIKLEEKKLVDEKNIVVPHLSVPRIPTS